MKTAILLIVMVLLGYAVAVNQPDTYAKQKARTDALLAETQRFIDERTPDLHPTAEERPIEKEAVNQAARIDPARLCSEIGREIKRAPPMAQSDYLRALITRASDEFGIILKNKDYSLIKSGGISLGMSDCTAAASLGAPQRINTTTNAYGTSAQWVYSRTYLYFDNGKLTSYQH